MGIFFNELKRRNVVRVAIAYIVIGWLAFQLGEIVCAVVGQRRDAKRPLARARIHDSRAVEGRVVRLLGSIVLPVSIHSDQL